ncbi:hypothetical protein Moror_6106 [Moniliophthora roreri MCA 2997]|uniref:Extracellular membrane protein CFEM domain-containing protein n=1 Tax=Moniliophthora roreri (strain MCA 2997) TaxID=1381753 RepID=V2WSK9_MONRO|nr:hypothetical protein Moror_6106 [Moniliophthora roreri MCA 2997]KAI3616673.1 hypothetical protein WG66_011622 [Moniliophthora roreri]
MLSLRLLAFVFSLLSIALAIPAEFILGARDTTANLGSKNLTAIPDSVVGPECSSQCPQSTLTFISNCTTAMCMCNDNTNTQILGCLDCLVQQKNLSQKLSDAIEAEYVNTCRTFPDPSARITNARAGNGATASLQMFMGGLMSVVLTVGAVSMGSLVL